MTVKVTVSLPKELVEFADAFAAQTNRSRSGMFADLLETTRRQMLRNSIIEGYRALAEENRRFASEAHSLAAEVWGEVEYQT